MSTRKYLLVGDIHAQVQDLADCNSLFVGIHEILDQLGESITIVFLGDLHDSHTTIRLEVTNFYLQQFGKLAKRVPVVLIAGNHDISNDVSFKGCALDAYRHLPIQIAGWGEYVVLDPELVAVSYCHTQEALIEAVKTSGCPYVLCHQTFVGAKYDNGFFAPDGFFVESIPAKQIISGHIHTAQSFSNVNYIGSPRWRTQSDAGIDKKLVLVDNQLSILQEFDTSQWCSKIIKVIDTEESPAQVTHSKHRIFVDIFGSKKYLEDRVKLWSGKARIRTFENKTEQVEVAESDGVDVAFRKYLDTVQATPELIALCQMRKIL